MSKRKKNWKARLLSAAIFFVAAGPIAAAEHDGRRTKHPGAQQFLRHHPELVPIRAGVLRRRRRDVGDELGDDVHPLAMTKLRMMV
jgi:hypothetical protein